MTTVAQLTHALQEVFTTMADALARRCHLARFLALFLARSVAPCSCRFTRQNGPSGK